MHTRRLRLTDQYWQRLGDLANAKQLDRAAYLEHYVNDLDKAKEELGNIVTGLQELAQQDEEHISDLTDEVADLMDEIEELQQDQTTLQQQIQQREIEKTELQRQIQQREIEKTELQRQIQQREIEKTKLQQQVLQQTQQLNTEKAKRQQQIQQQIQQQTQQLNAERTKSLQQSQKPEHKPSQQTDIQGAESRQKTRTSKASLLATSISLTLSLVIFIVGGFTLPSRVNVERSIYIDATPAVIFPLVGNLTEWSKWSPWIEMDPNIEITVSGFGKEQRLVWKSNNPMVSSGTVKITDISPPQYVVSHLEFEDQSRADTTFEVKEEEEGAIVSWFFDADMRESVPILKQPFRTYRSFFMDRKIGHNYEVGLNKLKTLAEQKQSSPRQRIRSFSPNELFSMDDNHDSSSPQLLPSLQNKLDSMVK